MKRLSEYLRRGVSHQDALVTSWNGSERLMCRICKTLSKLKGHGFSKRSDINDGIEFLLLYLNKLLLTLAYRKIYVFLLVLKEETSTKFSHGKVSCSFITLRLIAGTVILIWSVIFRRLRNSLRLPKVLEDVIIIAGCKHLSLLRATTDRHGLIINSSIKGALKHIHLITEWQWRLANWEYIMNFYMNIESWNSLHHL